MQLLILIGLLFLVSSVQSADPFTGSEASLKTNGDVSKELNAYSRMLQELQAKLYSEFGITRIYLAGGSLRTILNHLYFNGPMDVRDFDVLLDAGKRVDSTYADRMGRSLQSNNLGTYSRDDSHSNTYSNPLFSGPKRHAYHVGENIFLRWKNGGYLDIAIFHNKSDLDLNGLFDQDKILLPLDYPTSLSEFIQKEARAKSYAQLVAEGKIEDKFRGYFHALRKEPNIINWTDLEADPVKRSIRVLRTYGKMGKPSFPKEVRDKLRGLVASASAQQSPGEMGNILRIMEDKDPVSELRALQDIGVIHKFCPALDAAFNTRSDSELNSEFSRSKPILEGYASPLALGQLNALINLVDKISDMKNLRTLAEQVEPKALFSWAKKGGTAPFSEILGGKVAPLQVQRMKNQQRQLPYNFSPLPK